MKALFISNIPSPYRVDFFNELGKLCDLTVLFEKRSSDERDSSWNNYKFHHFKGVFLKGLSIKTDTAICFNVVKYLKAGYYDFIICSNYSSPTGFLAVHYLQRHKITYYLETDGGSPKSGKGLKEWLKKKVIKGANGYFSTGQENDRYFLAYGADKGKIYRYPFTSLYNKDVFDKPASIDELALLRKELQIKEKYVIISVGRFSYLNGYGKGYDVLLKAAEKLPDDIGWCVIGGQPTDEFRKMLERAKLTNFHFVDFKLKDELKKYYRASDLFVLMTVGEAWGLVVNEAMACGLPVITTEKCIAGVELIENGRNGFIVPVGSVDELVDRVKKSIYEKDILTKMGEQSICTIKKYTFENMALKHMEILSQIKEHNEK